MIHHTLSVGDLPTCAVDLSRLDEDAAQSWDHGFSLGYRVGHANGYRAGWDAADAHAEQLHRGAFHAVQAAARQPAHDELEGRRGRRSGVA